jgi:hypothetical protein
MNLLISISGIEDVSAFEKKFVEAFGAIVASGPQIAEGMQLLTAVLKEDVPDDAHPPCPMCAKKVADANAAADAVPPDEAKDTPALNEIDDECKCEDGGEECEECKEKEQKNAQQQSGAIKPQGTQPTQATECKVLTLTTSHRIGATYVPGQKNTTLSVDKLQVDEDRIRFKFNTFEHILPRQLESHKATVVNEAHEFNTQTVRLVLDFGGKSYPALVDLVEGEADVLTIGDDLFASLRKDEDDVSSK